jgi:transposase-like protein
MSREELYDALVGMCQQVGITTEATYESLHNTADTPGSVIHTDGWRGYSGLETKGYVHQITVLKGKKEAASELLPRVHLVISLLKRWLMGTHQGAVSHKHLDYYLDEFTFRFNRRTSASRGKLFYRLVQQAVAVGPSTYDGIVGRTRSKLKTAQPQAVVPT